MYETLDIQKLRAACAGRAIGGTIHFFETIDSTSTCARDLARTGAPEGTTVIAERQTAGRGRLGRTWESPPGRNLYLSLILRPDLPIETVPQITLAAGIATARAARHWVAEAGIKWPNDVLVQGKKVAGLLAEMERPADGGLFVILGIGVNLNLRPDELPEELRSKAAGLAAFTKGGSIDRAEFAARLLDEIEAVYGKFVNGGFAALHDEWNSLSLLNGAEVSIDDGGRLVEGVAAGLAADGTLRVIQPGGIETRVVAGDVTVRGGYQPVP